MFGLLLPLIVAIVPSDVSDVSVACCTIVALAACPSCYSVRLMLTCVGSTAAISTAATTSTWVRGAPLLAGILLMGSSGAWLAASLHGCELHSDVW